MPQFAPSPSVQSPAAWALRNLAPTSGPGRIGADLTIAYADGTVGAVLRQYNPIRKYGPIVGNGVFDDSATFIAAMASGDKFIDARGLNVYIKDVAFAADVTLLVTGSKFRIVGTTQEVFTATNVDGWRLTGPCDFIGDLTVDPGTGVSAKGIKIVNCANWRIDQASFTNIQGYGMHVSPGGSTRNRGEGGQVIAPSFKACVWGWYDTAGSGAEYTTVMGIHATACAQAGITTAAGNTNFTGGQSVDNIRDGVRVLAGSNSAHGIFNGVQINHNPQYNIYCEDVPNGETFIGCHVYNNGSNSGPVYFKNCIGMQYLGGFLDAPVYNDSGANSGMNVIAANHLPGTQFSKNSNNAGLVELWVRDNVTARGPSSLNDPAFLSVIATRSSSTQGLTAGTTQTIVFNTESIDNRTCYDNTTGVYTVPVYLVGVTHRAFVAVTVTAASGLAAGCYVEFRVNGSVVGYTPLVAINGTIAVASGAFTFVPAGTHAVDCRVFTIGAAVTPVVATTTSRLEIQCAP